MAEDVGLAGACNRGAAMARGHPLVFMDHRCVPSPGWLDALLADLDTFDQVGAVGPRLLDPDGRVVNAGGVLAQDETDDALEFRPRFPGWPGDAPEMAVPSAVACLDATAMAVRREAFEAAGGFHEGYRDLHEGLDLCLSLAGLGWTLLYEPKSQLTLQGTSCRPAEAATTRADHRLLAEQWKGRVHPEVIVDPEGRMRANQARQPLRPGHWGANVVGFFEAELGIGESARLAVAALEAAEVSCSTRSYYRHINRARHDFSHRGDGHLPHEVNLVCVNPDLLGSLVAEMGPDLFADRYTVALWHWELEELSPRHLEALELVDEVWVGSAFTRDAFCRHTVKPVEVLPLPLPTHPEAPAFTRANLGIPEGFVFGLMCDVNSVMARKNPEGLIAAFSGAFGPGEGPVLLIKAINGGQDPAGLARLAALAADRPDVVVSEGYLDPEPNRAWTGLVDCYVSLHRSEGFGLTLAEAMSWGTPVVATGYSGNLDFMTEANSYLVPWSYRQVPPGLPAYPFGARWAEPDLGAARAILRSVWEHPEEARARGARGREDIGRTHGLAAAAGMVAKRFSHLEVVLPQHRQDGVTNQMAPPPCWVDPRPARLRPAT
ncbi:MAG: glycosyltransferase, partial [Acidimicrobiales bacterium]